MACRFGFNQVFGWFRRPSARSGPVFPVRPVVASCGLLGHMPVTHLGRMRIGCGSFMTPLLPLPLLCGAKGASRTRAQVQPAFAIGVFEERESAASQHRFLDKDLLTTSKQGGRSLLQTVGEVLSLVACPLEYKANVLIPSPREHSKADENRKSLSSHADFERPQTLNANSTRWNDVSRSPQISHESMECSHLSSAFSVARRFTDTCAQRCRSPSQ
eukprot:455015-Amphidinium_carterae.1